MIPSNHWADIGCNTLMFYFPTQNTNEHPWRLLPIISQLEDIYATDEINYYNNHLFFLSWYFERSVACYETNGYDSPRSNI